MANRRMFNKELVSSDKFIDMPVSSQLLFFHLGMNADDEGFVSSPKRIMRSVCCSEDDLKILLTKRFLIAFESGVVVIKEWDKHNQIRKDRITPTIHHEEKSQLQLVDMQHGQPVVNQMLTNGLPSIVEFSIEEVSVVKKSTKAKTACAYSERFEKFWIIYERKGNKQLAWKKWQKLNDSQIDDIAEKVTLYVKNTNLNGVYPTRKNAETYLNPINEHWNDEVIIDVKTGGQQMRNGKVKDEFKEPDYNVEDYMMK